MAMDGNEVVLNNTSIALPGLQIAWVGYLQSLTL
jgi:hypothetical protein